MTLKTITDFETEISREETRCVGGVWFELVVGERQSDGKEISELRTWKNGVLEDVVCEFFNRKIRENRLPDVDWPELVRAQDDAWLEELRHG